MDFYNIVVNEKKDGTLQLRPDWKVGRSQDLMTQGGRFYAIWDEERGMWSKEIYDVARLVDQDLMRFANKAREKTNLTYQVAKMEHNSSKLWDDFHRFLRNSGDNYHNLDETLIFANTKVKKEDYASKRLPYSLVEGPHDAWDTLIGTLYNEEERTKLEWAIGAVVSGNSKFIQKFIVLYGPPGSGKSTILNIIEKLFVGYTTVFDARELAGNNNSFATAAFRSNPLVAIQHDGDLSRIVDNTKLNSIVAHEKMTVNEKYKAPFDTRSNSFLFMGTNVPVKISDAKSGIIRRLIDVVPTQKTIEHDYYHKLMDQVDFELGAIAQHCLSKYRTMGRNFYSNYKPTEMMLQTDVFYNFVESCFDIFKAQNGVSLKHAWTLYNEYCSETGIEKKMPQYKLREELKNYFYAFEERTKIDGQTVRSYYRGFKRLQAPEPETEFPIKLPSDEYFIELTEGPSIFDEQHAVMSAQYANNEGAPKHKWENVKTKLSDIDTSKLHYVKIPEEEIVIDFDLVDEDGEKSLLRNLDEASKWPPTYAELSQSGKGLHLHYIYTGDVHKLSNVYDVGVEIKTLLGGEALRRRLTLHNSMNITPLSGGLPLKEKPLLAVKSIQDEEHLRQLIGKNLRKEIHPGTKSSIDFIHHLLEEAYLSDLAYDVRDMRSDITTFAMRSTHHPEQCLKTVMTMQFVSKNSMPVVDAKDDDSPIVFYDVEVYSNLFIVCWKKENDDTVVRMINPEAKDIEALLNMKLVGFNCRRYDNHILYARFMGYSIEDLYHLSQKIIYGGNNKQIFFGAAYDISYTDIYDFSSKKQGLKRFQIELGIPHMELDISWDKPVPPEMWKQVEEYCVNDVLATEATFNARKQDFVARQILAELSGLSVNHTTQQHTAKIIFGEDKEPQSSFIYTNLADDFPGYRFDGKESTYRGEITGEGGYVHAEPGIYENVVLLDIASMHPTTIIELNLFGKYTPKFKELLDARLAIKKKDYDTASKMLNGRLEPFLTNPHEGYDIESANDLAYALKIVINIVYGLTSASFQNAFRDQRNKDNIVAKRGALFMIDLKNAVQEQGFTVAHIKTDSIKIPGGTSEIIKFVTEFGKKYGYDFEHETTYDWFCLVNDAVYIAKHGDQWTAVGAQFQHPYVFKTLFTKEIPYFDDFCETKNVTKGAMYLDFAGTGKVEDMVHVGRTGSFVPVVDNGGALYRVDGEKIHAVTGTKNRHWIDREMATNRMKIDDLNVDMDYFNTLAQKALDAIAKFDDVNGLSAEVMLPKEEIR